jgi:hypothetical protein
VRAAGRTACGPHIFILEDVPVDKVNIDELVNYKEEYTKFVQKPEFKRDRMVSLCPFHDDRKPSFSVDLKTGKFVCFACGKAGNYVSFRAELDGTSNADAYKKILREHGVDETKKEPAKPKSYTVEDYAAEKKLPAEWLHMVCSLESKQEQDGTPYVKIPYFNIESKVQVTRKRMGNHSFKWGYGSAGKMIPYGLWRKEGMEVAGYTILVEGESDSQTLWFLGYPALGVPGASTFKPEWVKDLQEIETVYIHKEPDRGGQTFFEKVTEALKDAGYKGKVEAFSCADAGEKDPSALYIKLGKDAAQDKLDELLENAKVVDLDHLTDNVPAAIEGAPKNLRQPPGWQYGEFGISRIDEKTDQLVCVCRTPIILTKRLKRTDTGEEKIEVAWKRDGEWHDAIFPRSMIFQSRSITALADKGCTVTSENAKQVVRFLGALEQENIDALGLQESTSTFGWQSRHRFLPGHAPDMVLDIEPSMTRWATAYLKNGTLDAWRETMTRHRNRYRFRFILASSFAAPLLAIIKQRIFFVYNWGGSRGGKTAALKAALSAWGDPERLMANFNATQVALERMAGFYCDLPLGIDERQLAGNKQEGLEKIVYMLANGTGRSRGSKDGGLQELRTWRSVILATGEEPIGKANSQTGVSTRVLEVVGAPFEDEASASDMHQQAALNCGWAGPEFIQYILDYGDQAIIDEYAEVLARIRDLMGTHNGSHTAAVATVVLADQMLSRRIFGEDAETAKMEAQHMAVCITADLAEQEQPDVNEQAAQYISDWISTNNNYFTDTSTIGQRYGCIEDGTAFILPTILREALEKGGFSYRKTMNWLAEKQIVQIDPRGKYQIVKKFGGRPVRMIAADLELLQNPPDDEGFTEVLTDKDDIPF